MKIVLLSARNSRLSGGLFYSVKSLGQSLISHCGQQVSYVCHDDRYSVEDKDTYGVLPLSVYHLMGMPVLDRWGFSMDIHRVLEAEKPDVIDIQGTWMYYSYAALLYKRKHPSVKIVITPRGTLDRLDPVRLSIPKRIALRLYEAENFRNADCFRALCDTEADGLRNFGIKAPIAVIPNGFNLPGKSADTMKEHNRTLLFVGRINPKKGLRELIVALKLVRDECPWLLEDWTVKIAGWDQNGHTDELKKLASALGLSDVVEFVGPRYGVEKEQAIMGAQAFVLTSFSEGMPMAVLEAWAYGLPVLMTDGCNLPEGFTENAAIRVEPTPESIAVGLQKIFKASPSELTGLGANGCTLVKERFQWDKIAEKTFALYECLVSGNDNLELLKYCYK